MALYDKVAEVEQLGEPAAQMISGPSTEGILTSKALYQNVESCQEFLLQLRLTDDRYIRVNLDILDIGALRSMFDKVLEQFYCGTLND